MDFWPYELLSPYAESWRLQGVALSGGTTLAGTPLMARTDGGGLWVGEQDFLAHGRERVKAARAVEAMLDGGVGQMVAWSFERPYAPAIDTLVSVPHSDGAPFSDGSEYLGLFHGAVAAADAPLRATQFPIAMVSGELQGGERFSINHPTRGMRRYTIMRVGENITIRPPLREAITAGTEIDFLRVGCVCRLANPDEFLGKLQMDGTMAITAKWVEAF